MMNTTLTLGKIYAASYKELQAMAKANGISANKKADALRAALIALVPQEIIKPIKVYTNYGRESVFGFSDKCVNSVINSVSNGRLTNKRLCSCIKEALKRIWYENLSIEEAADEFFEKTLVFTPYKIDSCVARFGNLDAWVQIDKIETKHNPILEPAGYSIRCFDAITNEASIIDIDVFTTIVPFGNIAPVVVTKQYGINISRRIVNGGKDRNGKYHSAAMFKATKYMNANIDGMWAVKMSALYEIIADVYGLSNNDTEKEKSLTTIKGYINYLCKYEWLSFDTNDYGELIFLPTQKMAALFSK